MHKISAYIYSMSGFGNPLSFKAITDVEINAVEVFIKENTFDFLTKQLCNTSVDNECEVEIDDEHLINYFGPLYANDTSSFQFQIGDRILIKEVVNYVKTKVDEGGPNANMAHFVDKRYLHQRKRKQKATTFTQMKIKVPSKLDENDMKSQLVEKVMPYFKQRQIDEKQIEGAVAIHIKDSGKVYGDILCAICKLENPKNKKAIRVYCNFDGKTKGCWVLSNFVKHLQRVHKMNINQNRKQNEPEQLVENENDKSNYLKKNESKDLELSNANVSCVLINDEELKIQEDKNCDTPTLLYDQLSAQITLTMAAVLENCDATSQMHFVVGTECRNLTVATIAGDGNCMFSSLSHQIFLHAINSKGHKDATKKLRADVVEYILNPINFPLFLQPLKDRVYDITNASDITDIEKECKIFVRHILGKNRTWGGFETLLATSGLYATNIIVFNEDSRCMKIKRAGENYNRSIAVAYRFGLNERGERVQNHYESICEIASNDIYAASHSIS